MSNPRDSEPKARLHPEPKQYQAMRDAAYRRVVTAMTGGLQATNNEANILARFLWNGAPETMPFDATAEELGIYATTLEDALPDLAEELVKPARDAVEQLRFGQADLLASQVELVIPDALPADFA